MLGQILFFIVEGVEDDIIDTIKKIKIGDDSLRNGFISEYKPFIKKTIGTTTSFPFLLLPVKMMKTI